jgi:peptidyl-prolyl cis-trans isomerase D
MYQNSSVLDVDTKNYISTLNSLGVNELKNVELSQGNLIVQVTDRKAMVNKFDVAVVKHTIDFSKQTYSDAYNKFSQYVSENKTIEALEENAPKFGFQVLERNDVTNSEHGVAGIRSTREAMKWLFDAKEGEVSPLYECGNNDRLLVLALTKIHPLGYRDWQSVKDRLQEMVLRDKKFEQLSQKLSGVKSVADAQKQGAVVDTVSMITFSSPVFLPSTHASEPALSGAVAATKQGEFSKSPVKGQYGAYVFQVLTKAQREGSSFDAKQQEQTAQQQAVQAAFGAIMSDLYKKAKVTDKRYLFF